MSAVGTIISKDDRSDELSMVQEKKACTQIEKVLARRNKRQKTANVTNKHHCVILKSRAGNSIVL